MQRIFLSLILALTVPFISLQAKVKKGDQQATQVGKASIASTGSSGYMQNWVFAGGALALAVVGIIIVSIDQGDTPSATS